MRCQPVNRTEHNPPYILHRQGLIDTRYFQIPITMISETGRHHFFSTPDYINILSHGSPYILKHNHSLISCITGKIRIFHFRISNIDPFTRLHTC